MKPINDRTLHDIDKFSGRLPDCAYADNELRDLAVFDAW